MEQGRKNILLTPGNYGRNAALEKFGIDIEKGIKISNYIGDTLDYLLYKQPERILIIGHAGKLSKTAGGIMNTIDMPPIMPSLSLNVFLAVSSPFSAEMITLKLLS